VGRPRGSKNKTHRRTMVELVCKVCGAIFYVTPCRAAVAHYCSLSCSSKDEYALGKSTGLGNHRVPADRIELVCQECGKTFRVSPYRKNEARFCSLSCRSKSSYAQARAAGFGSRQGCIAWNKGLKTGLVPKSAFRRGFTPWNKGTADLLKRRLSHTLKCAISRSVRDKKRGRHWETLVGWTLADLQARLESRFLPGMTWENYGTWHIDHAIPIAAFNIASFESPDFERCWALANLQPLWKRDNLVKNAKVTKPFQPSLL
jgi:ribosomal protein L33